MDARVERLGRSVAFVSVVFSLSDGSGAGKKSEARIGVRQKGGEKNFFPSFASVSVAVPDISTDALLKG